jgi:hypothetical protein
MSDNEAKKTKKVKQTKAAEIVPAVEYAIHPDKGIPSIDCSTWPLLLKVMF